MHRVVLVSLFTVLAACGVESSSRGVPPGSVLPPAQSSGVGGQPASPPGSPGVATEQSFTECLDGRLGGTRPAEADMARWLARAMIDCRFLEVLLVQSGVERAVAACASSHASADEAVQGWVADLVLDGHAPSPGDPVIDRLVDRCHR